MFDPRDNLIPWRDDFLSEAEHKLNKVFDTVFGKGLFYGLNDSGFPIADAYDADGKLHIEFPMPQVDADNIEVSEKDNILTVSGFVEKRREDAVHRLKEWKRGSFTRRFRLPDNVTGDPVASLKDGTLTVTYQLDAPKLEESTGKKIEIKKE